MEAARSRIFIQVEENPNCEAWDGQIYQSRTEPRPITHVRSERDGNPVWCGIAGVEENGEHCPAMACIVEDSGDGAAYLVYGGPWGLRLTGESGGAWGLPYMLLPKDGADLRFA